MSTLEVSNISDGTNVIASTYVTQGVSVAAGATNAGTDLRNPLNLSSVTDDGVGLYDFNVTSAISYRSASVQIVNSAPTGSNGQYNAANSSTHRCNTANSSGAALDTFCTLTIFGDLL